MSAEPEPQLIDDDERLAELCRGWLALPLLGIDTEFERTRTYFARPGLVQISESDRVYLLDPKLISDFTPLGQVIASTQTRILMHASGEDISLLARLTGATLCNLFDTQIAAAFCTGEDNASYQKLVKLTLGSDVDKGESRSDWLRRPLSPAQIDYAASDVRYLHPLHDSLAPELQNLNRFEWVREECDRLIANASAEQGSRLIERLVARLDLTAGQEILLKRLCTGRELEAAHRDLPRRHLIEDDVLVAVVNSAGPDTDGVTMDVPMPDGLSRRHWRTIERCLEQCPSPPDNNPLLSRQALTRLSPLVKRLQEKTRQVARELCLAPERLASRRMLESLLAHRLRPVPDLPEPFCGWRARVITHELLAIIESSGLEPLA